MAFRSFSTTGAAVSAASVAPAVPTGAASGDRVVVQMDRWETINPAVTPPAGFLYLGPQQVSTVGQGSRTDYWYKILAAADTGTYSFSWTGSMYVTATATCFSGLSGTPFVVGQTTSATNTPGSVAGTLPGTSDLLWGNISDDTHTYGAPTAPGTFTMQSTGNDAMGLGVLAAAAGGAVTVSGATMSGTAAWNGTTVIAIPSAAAVTPIPGRPQLYTARRRAANW